MRHTQIINNIIQAKGIKSYLEIGLGTGDNYQMVMLSDKVGIDPVLPRYQYGMKEMTSDQFFAQNSRKFNMIFIDGLHHHKQALKDINNALKYLTKYGVIVVHDCLPPSKESQEVPRRTKVWTGDVWRAWVDLRNRSDIHQVCINEDYGCGIILKSEQDPLEVAYLTYDEFVNNQKKLLNLVEYEQFENDYLHS